MCDTARIVWSHCEQEPYWCQRNTITDRPSRRYRQWLDMPICHITLATIPTWPASWSSCSLASYDAGSFNIKINNLPIIIAWSEKSLAERKLHNMELYLDASTVSALILLKISLNKLLKLERANSCTSQPHMYIFSLWRLGLAFILSLC